MSDDVLRLLMLSLMGDVNCDYDHDDDVDYNDNVMMVMIRSKKGGRQFNSFLKLMTSK